MRINIPQRFSTEWWQWLTGGTFIFAVCSVAVSLWFGLVSSVWILILVGMATSIVGDLVMALAFEAIAPEKVILGPGDRYKRTDQLKEKASVVSGFRTNSRGYVRVRGELWAARHHAGKDISLDTGQLVEVVDREGLVLLVSESK